MAKNGAEGGSRCDKSEPVSDSCVIKQGLGVSFVFWHMCFTVSFRIRAVSLCLLGSELYLWWRFRRRWCKQFKTLIPSPCKLWPSYCAGLKLLSNTFFISFHSRQVVTINIWVFKKFVCVLLFYFKSLSCWFSALNVNDTNLPLPFTVREHYAQISKPVNSLLSSCLRLLSMFLYILVISFISTD